MSYFNQFVRIFIYQKLILNISLKEKCVMLVYYYSLIRYSIRNKRFNASNLFYLINYMLKYIQYKLTLSAEYCIYM